VDRKSTSETWQFLRNFLFHGLLKNKIPCPLNRRGGVCYCQGLLCPNPLDKNTLLDYDLHYDHIKIFYDNTSTILMTKNTNQHSKTKHIEIQYHFLGDHYEKGDNEIDYVSTDFNLPTFLQNHLIIIDFFHFWWIECLYDGFMIPKLRIFF